MYKLNDWSRYIKNIYDTYPQLHIVNTGSSMLKIDHSKVDLSRRQVLYTMQGLSFREYLEFEGVGVFPVLSIEELVGAHLSVAMEIVSRTRVLLHFDHYLQMDYYPFYKESTSMDDYHSRLREVANVVVESEIANIPDSYLAIDDVEMGHLNRIPLWMFGMLY